ncbi:MAG: YraN family protein [Flavobacteriaceae bacterium]|nr:YraN family protein [Candidatus Onthonaster equi]
MSKSYDFGKEAENFAVDYFKNLDYKILARNYFFQKAEIDLIVEKDNVILIIEVKARTTNRVNLPENSVTTKKKKLLISAANDFILKNGIDGEVRFDILALLKQKDEWETNHIINAFSAIEL